MVAGFMVLLVCQLVGEIVSRGLGLPVPGPVLGLVMLVVVLHLRERRRGGGAFDDLSVVRVGDGLLANLSLLFVPAGVGVIQQAGVLRAQALALGAAVVVSTAVTLLATVLVFVGVKRMLRVRTQETSI